MPSPTVARVVALPPELERRRLVTIRQAAAILALSEDTFRRTYPTLIKKISPRRCGVVLGAVLDIVGA
jgi:hypothetical protein